MQLNKTILCIQRSIFFTYILRSDIFFVFSLVYFRSLMLKTCIFFIIYRIVLYMPQSIYDNNFFFHTGVDDGYKTTEDRTFRQISINFDTITFAPLILKIANSWIPTQRRKN